MSIGIQVENLPGDVREETLRDLFSEYGAVRVLDIVHSGVALHATASGVVEMPSRQNALRAVQDLNGRFYRGRLLHVESVQV